MRTKIIYEDDSILVCCKPAGLATQTAKVGQQDMVSELKNYLARQGKSDAGSRGKKAGAPYLGVIHRLDQPVEGLLVFAKESRAAAKLTAQLAGGTLNKHYYAVVCGQVEEKSGELVDNLGKDPATGNAVVISERGQEGKKAVLQYRVIGQISTPFPLSLMDIHIDTGRFHQIRVQMSHAGMPLLGDTRYGSETSVQCSRQLQVANVALCAYRIELKHPVTGRKMEFQIRPEGKIFSQFQAEYNA